MSNSIVAEMQVHKWAMEPGALKAFFGQLAGLPIEATSQRSSAAQPQLEIIGDTAIIPISGVLLKTVPEWMRKWGIEATGYDEIKSQIKQALADESINRIHLQVDSPGGMVAGLLEAADAIFNARSVKPVTATIEDIGASGAYWLTSQAQIIEAGRTAMVGAIGVFTVYTDYSEAYSREGIKIVVIRSGEHKGMSIDKVTDKQIAAVQEIIDGIADNFIDSVAKGRRQSKKQVREWATGQVWIATKAQELGLIDRIVRNQTLTKTGPVRKVEAMNEQTIKKVKAQEKERLAKFKMEFDDDLEFAIEACAKNLSLEEAKTEYWRRWDERVQKAKAAVAKPILTKDPSSEDQGDFMDVGRELAAAEGITLGEALKRVCKEQPALHRAYKEKCQGQNRADYGRGF